MLNKEQTDFLLVNAYNAAVRAGARIIDIYTGDADYGVDLKSDHTPITIADRESHELIKNYLSQTRIPLLSEEGRDLLYEERRNWDLFWMVDPLDGTKEFLKGNGEFTVNIALMCDNEPYIGIIYVPYIRRIYFAQRGVGSYLKTVSYTHLRADTHRRQPFAQYGRDVRARSADQVRASRRRSHRTGELVQVLPAGGGGRRGLRPHVEYLRVGHGGRRGDSLRGRRRGRAFRRRNRHAVQQNLAAQSLFRLPK